MDHTKMLEKMLYIRLFEERISELYHRNVFRCPVHLSVGHEASAVGVCSALDAADSVFGHHRSHHHYLAKGGDPRCLLLEMLGSPKGCSQGMGGSTHLRDKAAGFIGSAAIISGLLPVASGYAHALKLKNQKNIVVAFCGDAAIEEGVFFETLNMANLWGVPLLVVMEDNSFSCDTPKDQRYGIRNLSALKNFYGIEFAEVNGRDVNEVYAATSALRGNIIETQQPGILHVKVARAYEHCGPARKEDINWDKMDPLQEVQDDLRVCVNNDISNLFRGVFAEESLYDL